MEMEDKFLKYLESDEVFSQFTDDEFDAKTHATRIIQSHAISQQLAKLAEGVNLLDRELHSQVVAHHQDLLSQATGIETLDGVLHMMQTRIQSLLLAVERIRSRVVEPYNKIVTRTMQLRRLQETCDLLRHIIRIMYLSKRLHSQLQGGTREITKAAQSLNELDYMSSTVDLSGIEVVDADRRFIRQARKDVELQAHKMLEQGIEAQNQTQVATALQVFLHLGSLQSTVEQILQTQKQRLLGDIQSAVDVDALTQPHQQSADKRGVVQPGRASGISVTGNSASFRAALWTNLEKLADNIYTVYSQVLHLQKVLMRKRDPVTHVVFIDLLTDAKSEDDGSGGNVKNLVQDLWKFLTTSLTQQFTQTADSNTFLRQVLEAEYPKLVRLYSELWRRIQSLGGAATLEQMSVAAGGSDADNVSSLLTVDSLKQALSLDDNCYNGEHALRDTLSQFETAYLSRSLSRLIDPINLFFSSSSASPLTDDEIDGVVKVISSEWSVASIDSTLAVSMSKNIAKTVVFFCTKSEQLLVTETDSSCQVIGPATSAQTLNAGVVNSLYKFHQAVSKVVSQDMGSSLPEAATLSFHEALQSVVELMAAAVQPLLDAVGRAMEAILLTIHDEDFSQGSAAGLEETRQCSLYMKELDQFVSRAANTYLAQFICTDFIIHSVRPVVCRCMELFVQQTSLVCPLSEAGKLRLAADYAQLEASLSSLCHKLSDLGRPYRMIRAIRPVLFQSSECLSNSDVVGDVIPYSTALHLLYTRAHPDIKPPYQSLGWSRSEYCDWLTQHPAERDRLSLIKGSLEAYVQSVTSRGGKEFSPVYPVMLQLLQRAMQQLHD